MMKIEGFTEIVVGIWLFASAFFGLGLLAAAINNFVIGVIFLIVSLFIGKGETWQSWLAGILGFWMIIAAFVPFLIYGVGLYLNDIAVGVIVMAMGLIIFFQGKKVIHQVKTGRGFNYCNYGSE